MRYSTLLSGLLAVTLLGGCANTTSEEVVKEETSLGEKSKTPNEFKKYWNQGRAEITSYALKQARYGEIHSGTAVMIFVTEPFSPELQVKPNKSSKEDVSVLKLNFSKKFITGIYPYSMMTSSFVPINYLSEHAMKVTTTSQEWCGHTFTQLNNRKNKFVIHSFSYFEDEGDQEVTIDEAWLEDEVWNKIRLNPEILPIGNVQMVPSLFYIRLRHKETKAYVAETSIKELNDSLSVYQIVYPELERELAITFQNSFPYEIESWKESYVSGAGDNAKMLSTEGVKMNRILSDYWNENGVNDTESRKTLFLNK